MKTIVITGGTRGIGRGMAEAFLKRGCKVVVGSRGEDHVAEALSAFAAIVDPADFAGAVCDVRKMDSLAGLYDLAKDRFGAVDIWVNNAGLPQAHVPFQSLNEEEIRRVVEVNLMGVMFGTQVALRCMLAQGHGMIFNMEGLGSEGRINPNMNLYGSTKRAVRYFTRSLVHDLKGSPVRVGFLSPGMVVTDFLIQPDRELSEIPESTLKIFNILADRVETVAPFLVKGMLAEPKHGVRIAWLTFPKMMWRFLTAPLTNRQVIDSE